VFRVSTYKGRVNPSGRRLVAEAEAHKPRAVIRRASFNGGSISKTAGVAGPASTPGGGLAAPGGLRTPSTIRNQTGNPLLDNSLVDYWIPIDPVGLHQLWRRIYLRDPICGPAVDFFRELPWSEWTLSGVDDKLLQRYDDCLHRINLLGWLPEVSGDFLVLGKTCLHFLWDRTKGEWKDLIVHDPDHIEVSIVPLVNQAIKVDLKPTPAHQAFILSPDPRDQMARKELDPNIVRMIMSGEPIPLDPRNTLYLPRRAFPYDVEGVSLFSRVIYYVALERPLFTASILAARRRAGPVTHIAAGNEEWEPNNEELDALALAFMEAEEDAVSAVFATRNDVQVNRAVSSLAADMWKINDESQFISEGKMRALGINDAFLAGDASINTTEAATSVFLERIRAHRRLMTERVIQQKIFREMARANRWVKRTPAEIAHHVREDSDEKAAQDDKRLAIPTVNWNKSLKPTADEQLINLLRQAQEWGLPISIRDLAAATGVDIDGVLGDEKDEIGLREKLKKWQEQMQKTGVSIGATPPGGAGGGEGGMPGMPGEGGMPGGEEGAPAGGTPPEGAPEGGEAPPAGVAAMVLGSATTEQLQQRVAALPLWNGSDRCIDVHRRQVQELLTNPDVLGKLSRGLSARQFCEYLQSGWTFTPRQAEVVGYVFHRVGLLPDFRVPAGFANAVLKSRGNDTEDAALYRELQYMEHQHRAVRALRHGAGKQLRREFNIPNAKLFTGV
jgi:hypothetical protein